MSSIFGSGLHGALGANNDKTVIAERVKQQRKGKMLTQKEIQEKIITLAMELENELKVQHISNPREIIDKISTQEMEKKLAEYDYEVEIALRYFTNTTLQKYQPNIHHTPRKISVMRKINTTTQNTLSKEIDNEVNVQQDWQQASNSPTDEDVTPSSQRGPTVVKYHNSEHRRSIMISRRPEHLEFSTPVRETTPQTPLIRNMSETKHKEQETVSKTDLKTMAKRSWSSKIIYK